MKVYKGKIKGEGLKFGIIVSRFNEFVSQKLLEGALDALERHQASKENIEIFWVTGSFEIPSLAARLIEKEKFNALICLGAIIRGDTSHFELISNQVSRGISTLALKANIPLVFGIITADTLEQAIERAGTKMGNKGWDAAITAMEMANLYKEIEES